MKIRELPAEVKLFSYFAILALCGTILLSLPCMYKNALVPPLLDVLFTTVSAMCVTGLSTFGADSFNMAGLTVLMLVIEAGGLGLIIFFSLYLVRPGVKVSHINRSFMRGFFLPSVETNTKAIITAILRYTFAIQLICAFLLMLILKSEGREHFVFYALFLAVSAFCNAGFSPYPDSLASFSANIPFTLIISFLVVAGGLGFTVMQDGWHLIRAKAHGKRYRLAFHSKIVLVMTAFLLIIPTVLFFIVEYSLSYSSLPLAAKVNSAFFQSVTVRTAGFEMASQKTLSAASAFLSCVLMIIGGNPGSMAGGIKTTTFYLLLCNAFRDEGDVGDLTIFRHDISDRVISKSGSIAVKAFIFLFAVLFALMISEGANISAGLFTVGDLLFEVSSALSTAGLSRAVTPLLSTAGKILIIITMYVGRTGIIAMTLRLRAKSILLYCAFPHEEILVG